MDIVILYLPGKDSIAMLLIILELSLIPLSVFPLENTISLHLVVNPLALICSILVNIIAIFPLVNS